MLNFDSTSSLGSLNESPSTSSMGVKPEEAVYDSTLADTDRKVHYHDVKDLDHAYEKSGFDRGAIVPHREMVIILDQALKDTEVARKKAVAVKRYKDAARLSEVQKIMRVQFRQRQQNQLIRQQDHELKQMAQTKELIRAKFKQHWDTEMEHIDHECEANDRLLEQKQLKGRRTLQRRIKSLPKPKNRMSKQMISLMHAEAHMAHNHQYRDAEELNKRITKQLPVEKARFRQVYEKRIVGIQENHYKKEEFQTDLQFEKNKGDKIRARDEKQLAVIELKRQLANHELSLRHALKNEINEPAGWKRTVRPAVDRRANFHKTSSTRRGTQVLASVSHARLEAPSLCDMHDFDSPLKMSTLEWNDFQESKRLGYTQKRK